MHKDWAPGVVAVEKQKKIVWIVSDGTGRTALQVIKAAFYQFTGLDVDYRIVDNVTTKEQIFDLMESVKQKSGMLVYTIVSKSNRRLLNRLAVENHILAVDLFGPLISILQKFLEQVPVEVPGLSYKMNRDYFRMVEAVDFTIKHDDGMNVESANRADIVIVGPSRVGKTPLAVYLGYMGWKVANIPVIQGHSLPGLLDHVPFKVFCLVIEPGLLQKRRIDRIQKLGDPEIAGYTDAKSISDEIEFCRVLADDGKKWPLIDMSYRTVEDVAKDIIQLVSI